MELRMVLPYLHSLKCSRFLSYTCVWHFIWLTLLIRMKLKIRNFYLTFSITVVFPHMPRTNFYQLTNIHSNSSTASKEEMTTVCSSLSELCQDSSYLRLISYTLTQVGGGTWMILQILGNNCQLESCLQ